jgi:transposase
MFTVAMQHATAREMAAATDQGHGRPSYHPATLLKIYIYGYLNRVPSSRRLERECQRNIELIWLTGQLAPDFKTVADFRIRTQFSARG